MTLRGTLENLDLSKFGFDSLFILLGCKYRGNRKPKPITDEIKRTLELVDNNDRIFLNGIGHK